MILPFRTLIIRQIGSWNPLLKCVGTSTSPRLSTNGRTGHDRNCKNTDCSGYSDGHLLVAILTVIVVIGKLMTLILSTVHELA